MESESAPRGVSNVSRGDNTVRPTSHSASMAGATSESGAAQGKGRQRDSRSFSRGRGGGGRGGHQGKKRDMGRNEWSKQKGDKRKRNESEQAAKKQKINSGEDGVLPIYATKFDEAEIKAEDRRPKKKVAVMIGYSGTGYKGMQLAHDQKTIEGDLFKAFVDAGAISKANADDPKKSSFVRCARTDKGVHAAGNVISLKLIVEEEGIIEKINKHLNPQIRVWGYERTNNSFSAYQLCDSRIYEYLIPTSSFLPPHPRSYLGRKCQEWAEKKNDVAAWKERQEEVVGYWEKVDEEMIKPILEDYDEDTRAILDRALWLKGEQGEDGVGNTEEDDIHAENESKNTESAQEEAPQSSNTDGNPATGVSGADNNGIDVKDSTTLTDAPPTLTKEDKIARAKYLDQATKRLRTAYTTAKRSYRIPRARLTRIRDALALYVGTKNYHNYTVAKSFSDPSAKRVIKSFNLNPTPILINGTEWLSLKVHGQSFMMHQIRKMVGMVALVVRCGADPHKTISASYGYENISIPKAPSLGLLLERPVFDSYNRRAGAELSKDPIDFDKYKTEMEAFKQSHIYERMYDDEEKENVFGNFFLHVDAFPAETFLFVTSGGVEATRAVDDGAARRDHRGGQKKAPVHVDIDADGESDVERDNQGDEG